MKQINHIFDIEDQTKNSANRYLVFLLFWTVTFGPQLSVFAEPVESLTPDRQERVDTLVEEGLEQYGKRQYEEAIESFKQALEIQEEPELLYNIARSYERLVNSEEALVWYQRLVEMPGTTGELRTKALTNITMLRREINAKKSAQQAALDGDEKEADGGTGHYSGADMGKRSSDDSDETGQRHAGSENENASRDKKKNTVLTPLGLAGLGVAGVGAVGVVVGGVFGGLVLKKNSDYEAAGYDPSRVAYGDEVKRNALIFDVAFSSGAVLVATGVALIVVNAAKQRSKRETSVDLRKPRVLPSFLVQQEGLIYGLTGRF
jgi:tetratricopeptide (TPR) repeat protein